MALMVSGKNVDIGQALRSRIESTISAAAGKYCNGGYSGHVTVTRSGHAFHTDCTMHLDTGAVFAVSADGGNAHLSFGLAAERLEKQLRRYKRRLKAMFRCRHCPSAPRHVIWNLRKRRWYASAMRTTAGSKSFTVVATDISAGSTPC